MGTAIKRPERQSARMSKITNDGLTRPGIGCFIAVAPLGVKGLKNSLRVIYAGINVIVDEFVGGTVTAHGIV